MASTRRLTAILAADVAGYSRLMRADEEGTHERLKGVRRQLIDPKITEHHGRIVKTTGDGLLAEPGGICISRVVRDEIRDKLPYPFEDKGEQSVKNIARPVRVYALRPEAVADLSAAGVPPDAPRRRRIAFAAMAASAAAALVIA